MQDSSSGHIAAIDCVDGAIYNLLQTWIERQQVCTYLCDGCFCGHVDGLLAQPDDLTERGKVAYANLHAPSIAQWASQGLEYKMLNILTRTKEMRSEERR